MALWLPGPATATGEDCAELHLHGGRAVVSAVEAALAMLPGLRRAEPGEFTRRAFANGRIDLAEAEGLADLLSAETELQRRGAMAMAGGDFSRLVAGWRGRLLALSAALEAALDFAGDDDIDDVTRGLPEDFGASSVALADELATWLARPRAEPLREGFRVVLAGPPNAGKSTLFNALVEDEAAITAAEPGTTREVEMPDGSHLYLKKLAEDYDPTSRERALSVLHASRAEQKLLTGLLYAEPDLFFAVALAHTSKVMPLVYTPLVGAACTSWQPLVIGSDKNPTRPMSWYSGSHDTITSSSPNSRASLCPA